MKMFRIGNVSPFIAASGITLFLLSALKFLFTVRIDGDALWYAAIAEGRINEVIQPFSSRFLHAFFAGWLSRLFHINLAMSFFTVGVLSLFFFVLVCLFILQKNIGSLILTTPLFLLPYFASTLKEIFLPDIFYTFLISLFFLFLFYNKKGASLLTLFLLFLARESTLLLSAVFALAAWFKGKRKLAAVAVLVAVVSVLVTSSVVGEGQSNIHNLSGGVYLVAKFGYNLVTNTIGLRPWVSTYTTCEPIWKIGLPAVFYKFSGNIREAGLCGFDIQHPVDTLTAFLTTFGVLPLVLFYILKKDLRNVLKNSPFWLLVALAYGIMHYFIAIPAGTGVARIVGYGWPAFLLATPIIFKNYFEISKKLLVKLLIIHTIVAWLPLFLRRLAGDTIPAALFSLLLIVLIYAYSWRFLNKKPLIKSSGEENDEPKPATP